MNCPRCKSKGTIGCPRCNGKGRIYELGGLGPNYSCSHCNGSGEVRCPNCNGSGSINQVGTNEDQLLFKIELNFREITNLILEPL